MSFKSFKPDLQKIIDSVISAQVDGKISVNELLSIIANGLHTLENLLRDIGGDDEAFNELVADCESLTDQYLVPLDLSRIVGKFIEKVVVDPALHRMVRPVLLVLRARLV